MALKGTYAVFCLLTNNNLSGQDGVKDQGLTVTGQGSRVKGQGSKVKGQGSRVRGQESRAKAIDRRNAKTEQPVAVHRSLYWGIKSEIYEFGYRVHSLRGDSITDGDQNRIFSKRFWSD